MNHFEFFELSYWGLLNHSVGGKWVNKGWFVSHYDFTVGCDPLLYKPPFSLVQWFNKVFFFCTTLPQVIEQSLFLFNECVCRAGRYLTLVFYTLVQVCPNHPRQFPPLCTGRSPPLLNLYKYFFRTGIFWVFFLVTCKRPVQHCCHDHQGKHQLWQRGRHGDAQCPRKHLKDWLKIHSIYTHILVCVLEKVIQEVVKKLSL